MIPLKDYDGKERRKEVSEFRKAHKKLGMETTLGELIGLCDDLADRCKGHACDGDYIKQLKTDFETTLKNYMKRHDEEETKKKKVVKKKAKKKETMKTVAVQRYGNMSIEICAANARVTNTPVNRIRSSSEEEYPPSGRE